MSKHLTGIEDEVHRELHIYKRKIGAKNINEALVKLLETANTKEEVCA